jgi:uncharacterized damage-inducible protein DinB
MPEAARVADQLRRAFAGEAWHGDSLLKILKGVGAAQAAGRPIKNAHAIWELVLHITAWDRVGIRRLGGEAVELSDAENFPPVADASDGAWARALGELRRVHEELVATVASLADSRLEEKVPGKEGAHYTFLLHAAGAGAARALSCGADCVVEEDVRRRWVPAFLCCRFVC